MRYLLSVLLIVCVLLAHVLYIFQDQSFFHKQFTLLGSYERQPTVMEEANELMDYRYDDKELIDRDVYTLLEKQHLLDVQNIIQKIRLVFFVFLGLFLLLVLWSLIS